MKLLFLRVAPVATTGSHCGGRVPRHKGASRVGGSPDLSGLAPSGVGTPLRVRQFLMGDGLPHRNALASLCLCGSLRQAALRLRFSVTSASVLTI
ncbi:hypothetical protein [Nostoc sp.]